MVLDIFATEKIIQIAKKWHVERYDQTFDELQDMMSKIYKLVK